MNKNILIITLILFLSGCGAIGTGLGIMLLGDDDSATNNPPSVTIDSPRGEERNDLITIEYTISDGESNPANISVEWSTNQTDWNMATELPGDTIDTHSDGLVGISTSPGGEKKQFVWRSFRDIPAFNQRNIYLRITPTDGSTGVKGTPEIVQFDVMNEYTTTLLGRIPTSGEEVPFQPFEIAYRPSTNTCFVSNEKTSTIIAINLTTGNSTKVVGTGLTPFNGDDLLGEETNIAVPRQLVFTTQNSTNDPSVAFVDGLNQRVRLFNLNTRFVKTLAGIGEVGSFQPPFSDFASPTDLALDSPVGVAQANTEKLKGIFFSERNNRAIRFINLGSTQVKFYTNIFPPEFNTQQLIEVPVKANEMRFIAGTRDSSFTLRDGPIWATNNADPAAGSNQKATFLFPQTIKFVATPQPHLYVADAETIRIVHLGGSGDSNLQFYPNADTANNEDPVQVKPGYTGSILTFNNPNNLMANPRELTDDPNNPLFALEVFAGEVGGLALRANPNTPSVKDIFFSDSNTHSVWRINGRTGKIRRIAGSESFGFFGDGGPATDARLAFPAGLAVAGDFLLIADKGNNRIRAVNLSTTQTNTIVGKSVEPEHITSISFGPSSSADSQLFFPVEVERDSTDNQLYVSDLALNRIVRFDQDSRSAQVVAGNGRGFSSGDGGSATDAGINAPRGLALYRNGNEKALLIGDGGAFGFGGGGAINQNFQGRVRLVNLGSSTLSFGTAVTNLDPGNIQTLVGGGTIPETTDGSQVTAGDLVNVAPGDVRLDVILDVFLDEPESGKLPIVYIVENFFGQIRILAYNPNSESVFFNMTNSSVGGFREVIAGGVSAIAIFTDDFNNMVDINLNDLMALSDFGQSGQVAALGGARSKMMDTDLTLILPVSFFGENSTVVGLNYGAQSRQILTSTLLPSRAAVLAGKKGSPGYNGDGIAATEALLNSPAGVFYVPQNAGNGQNPEILGIADSNNNLIRVVFGQGSSQAGIITSPIGTLSGGFNRDTLPPENTFVSFPHHGLVFPTTNFKGDVVFSVLIVDTENGRIRRFIAGN